MYSIRESVELAIEIGWKIFPLYGLDSNWVCMCGNSHEFDQSAGKHPLTVNGMKAASSSGDRIDDWLERTTNFGVACKESGICVLDVDPRNGGFESFEKLQDDFPEVDWQTISARTGEQWWLNQEIEGPDDFVSRGQHIYFSAPKDMLFRANLGDDYPGIDIKHNGYVVLPGSKHHSRTFYSWEHSPIHVELKEFPSALYELALRHPWPPQEEKRAPAPPPPPVSKPRSSEYGLAALNDECEKLKRIPEGRRNPELYEAGLRMGSLVAGGQLTLDDAYSRLSQAGTAMGLEEKEVEKTLVRPSGSGSLQIGMGRPRGPQLVSSSSITKAPIEPFSVQQKDTLNIVKWEEAFGKTQDVDWLVPGLIAQGRGHAIYSSPGLGKSLLTLEISACLASGRDVLGFEHKNPLKVLYLDQENNITSDIVPRLMAMGFSPEILNNLAYASFPEIGSLDGAKGHEIMENILDSTKPQFVIFDTLARFVEGEENSNNTWNNFYVNVGVPMKRRGIAYLRLDHSGKNEEQGMRGGSAKQGDLDLVWRLTGGLDENSFYLINEKTRLPLDSKKLKLNRVYEPRLGHIAVPGDGGYGFAELFEINQRFVAAKEMIREVDAQLDVRLGQKKMWERLKPSARARGIKQNLFTEAHKSVRGEADDIA